MITGETLRILRVMKNMKQATLAKALKVSQSFYCRLEQSKVVTAERILQFRNALGVSNDEFEKLIASIPPQNDADCR